ncbi:uncharacterized protein LOC117326041 [Pecten maximus]|uniref:uncharacterized protein LOC117326041 n=1 Tax=Pecten maximus TaxID=6579 RepID=UPI001458B573|nr:uncharacterized protein LOC117326041 [Pecten maximus]XP_033738520.1 uncharacterized protein LOC117326041 [Pecten maximus]
MFQHVVTSILALDLLLSFIHLGATYNGPIDTKLLQDEGLLLADSSGHVTVYEGSAFEETKVSEEVESEVGTENYFETGSAHNTTFTDLGGFKNDHNNYTRHSIISGKSDEEPTPTSIIVAIVIVAVALLCAVVVSTKLLYERYFKRNDRKNPTDYDSDEYSVMMTWD